MKSASSNTYDSIKPVEKVTAQLSVPIIGKANLDTKPRRPKYSAFL